MPYSVFGKHCLQGIELIAGGTATGPERWKTRLTLKGAHSGIQMRPLQGRIRHLARSGGGATGY